MLGVLRLRQAVPPGGCTRPGYADFVPLGAEVQPRVVEYGGEHGEDGGQSGVRWTVRFRDGGSWSSPTRPALGHRERWSPTKDLRRDPVADLRGQGLAGESRWLGVEELPTLEG